MSFLLTVEPADRLGLESVRLGLVEDWGLSVEADIAGWIVNDPLTREQREQLVRYFAPHWPKRYPYAKRSCDLFQVGVEELRRRHPNVALGGARRVLPEHQ